MEAVRIETARAALDRGVRDLAEGASVAANAGLSTIDAPRRVTEAAGAISITGDGEGPDVGLRRGAQPS